MPVSARTTPAERRPQTTWRVVCIWLQHESDGRTTHWSHQHDEETLSEARSTWQAHKMRHSDDPSATVDLLICEPGLTPKSLLGDPEQPKELTARARASMAALATILKERKP